MRAERCTRFGDIYEGFSCFGGGFGWVLGWNGMEEGVVWQWKTLLRLCFALWEAIQYYLSWSLCSATMAFW